jgi:hypothetical protein
MIFPPSPKFRQFGDLNLKWRDREGLVKDGKLYQKIVATDSRPLSAGFFMLMVTK